MKKDLLLKIFASMLDNVSQDCTPLFVVFYKKDLSGAEIATFSHELKPETVAYISAQIAEKRKPSKSEEIPLDLNKSFGSTKN